jgi:hypothetical protein
MTQKSPSILSIDERGSTHHKQIVFRQMRTSPTDEQIVQANVAQILADPYKLYDHQRGRLDAVTVIEVAISERLETIRQHRAISGRQISAWSRDLVLKLRHEIGLMEEAVRRLRSLDVTTASPLAFGGLEEICLTPR